MAHTTQDVITRLCADDYSLWRNDEINRHELSRRTGVALAVVSRLFNDRRYRPQKKNLKKFADYFELTVGQITGVQQIENLHDVPLILKRLEVQHPTQENKYPIICVESFNQNDRVVIAINYLMPPRTGAISLWQYHEYYFYGIRFSDGSFMKASALNRQEDTFLDIKFEELHHVGRIVPVSTMANVVVGRGYSSDA